ncbi:hypothetical protein OAE37_01805 [Pirellulaceae bacterium]|jgi:hypothetical protein|nr:hypothetical protein [Pirellulaceae bacterium]
MARNGIFFGIASAIAILNSTVLATSTNRLSANDEIAITELYGQAVHAYFDGDYENANKGLTDAIELGTDDPRVYYFRGLTKRMLGRNDEATKDFEAGGKLEALAAAQFYPIGRSLERVQGEARMEIEKIRKQAKIAIRLREKKIEDARIESFKRNEKVRQPVKTTPLPKPNSNAASQDDPFGTGNGNEVLPTANSQPMPNPAVVPKPTTQPDPFGTPEKSTEPAKTDGGADPFGTPEKSTEPAKTGGGVDPFGTPEKSTEPAKTGGEADPFGTPDKTTKPKKTDEEANPFFEPDEKADENESQVTDPFADPEKKGDDKKEYNEDPFGN